MNDPHTAQGSVWKGFGVAGSLLVTGGLLWWADASQKHAWFAWRDLFIVHLLAAVPFGLSAAAAMRRDYGNMLTAFVATTLWLITVAFVAWTDDPPQMTDLLDVGLIRWGIALAASVAAAGLVHVGTPHLLRRERTPSSLTIVGTLIISWLLPKVYTEAHLQFDQQRFTEFVEQDRLGDAAELARRLSMTDPQGTWRGHPWPRVLSELRSAMATLERQLPSPLTADASLADRLDQARTLAMLGRGSEAVGGLTADAATSPAAALLLATWYENRQEWNTARLWYRQALQQLGLSPANETMRLDLVQAWTGIGFCERKLGNLPMAEAAYQQVLQLLPTGESHFLLAQFYEDTQRADLAQQHARRAVQLDPAQFAEPARRLTNRLVMHHFGCFGVYRSNP